MNSNSLGLLLSGDPIKITSRLKFYQPTVRDVVVMGEERYNLLLRIWTVTRDELIPEENDYTQDKDDYIIWFEYIMSVPQMREALEESCLVFFRKKIEFLPLTHTISIGEGESSELLDLGLYLTIKSLFSKLVQKRDDKDQQYKETKKMSAKEKEMLEKMKAAEAKLNRIKHGDSGTDDVFGKQIVSLVAIGHYTYEQVYDMTMLQFTNLLMKYVDIERYELHTVLSPYISSKDAKSQENKHWLS
jgi:hypothetical protein